MKEKAEYRSSRRSRALIRSALLSLMKDKPFDRITITEIARRADINRGTFYAHYRNIGEVLESIQTDVALEMSRIFEDLSLRNIITDCEKILTKAVDFISRDPQFYRTLLSIDNGNNVVEMWKSNIISYLVATSFFSSSTATQQGILSYRCAVTFIVNGTVESIVDSLLGQNNIPLDVLPHVITQSIRMVMKYYISI